MSVYILAEIASAHMGDPDLCLELIHKAKEAGADGVKVQVWFPEEGDFSHMMDKFMGEDGYKKIIASNNKYLSNVVYQTYGSISDRLCEDNNLYRGAQYVNVKHRHIPRQCIPVPQVGDEGLIIGVQLYPTPIHASLLHKIKDGYGYADHSHHASPWAFAAPLIAIERGATLIEKHICLNREELKKKSKDWVSALEPHEFKEFVQFIREAETAL